MPVAGKEEFEIMGNFSPNCTGIDKINRNNPHFGNYRGLFHTITTLVLGLIVTIASSGQSLTGTNGYFLIPSAEMQPDRSLWLGSNLIHKNYKKWGSPDHHALNFFASATYLPFLEVSIRFNRLIGLEDYSSTVGDRMASARLLLLHENRNNPALLVGFQNFFTTIGSGEASHFNSTYLVATKNFTFRKYVKVGLTAGYGHKLFRAADYQFIGFFGGLSISPRFLSGNEVICEYDAEKWNIGVKLNPVKRLVVLVGLEGMQSLTGGISYRFLLP